MGFNQSIKGKCHLIGIFELELVLNVSSKFPQYVGKIFISAIFFSQYYFAVDTTYVTKKLSLILFPYVQKDWSIRYSHGKACLQVKQVGMVFYLPKKDGQIVGIRDWTKGVKKQD